MKALESNEKQREVRGESTLELNEHHQVKVLVLKAFWLNSLCHLGQIKLEETEEVGNIPVRNTEGRA